MKAASPGADAAGTLFRKATMYWPGMTSAAARSGSDWDSRPTGDVIGSSTPQDKSTAADATAGTTRFQKGTDCRPPGRLFLVPILISQVFVRRPGRHDARVSPRCKPRDFASPAFAGFALVAKSLASGGERRTRRASLTAYQRALRTSVTMGDNCCHARAFAEGCAWAKSPRRPG